MSKTKKQVVAVVERDKLHKCVVDLICEIAAGDPADVTDNASLKEDLMFDDLDLIELCVKLEVKFDLAEIDCDDGERFNTVKDVIKYVRPRVVS